MIRILYISNRETRIQMVTDANGAPCQEHAAVMRTSVPWLFREKLPDFYKQVASKQRVRLKNGIT